MTFLDKKNILTVSLFLLATNAAVAQTAPVSNAQIMQRIMQMEQEIATLKQQLAAKESDAQAQKLNHATVSQHLALVERKIEVQQEVAKATAAKTATVELNRQKGLLVTSPDKNLQIKLRGYAQFDARTFLNDKGNTGKDDFLARRVRPILEVTAYKDFSFRLAPDFANTTRVQDAHADFKLLDSLQFRVGKFKPPLELERLQSGADIEFIERGHPTNFSPSRDVGFQLYGDIIPNVLEYQVGVFNGAADLANSDTDADDKKDYIARVFAHPFRNADTLLLQGLGVGIAGSIGDRDGSVGNTILGSYNTAGQQAFFSYLSTTYASGTHWRLFPQAYYYYNSLGVQLEYAISAQTVRNGANTAQLEHNAWQVSAGYVLTGEDNMYKGGVVPQNPFNLATNSWGAFEVLGRVGETKLDNATFPTFANNSLSANKASTVGTGISWYPNENFKFAINYDWTTFDGGAATVTNRPDENALVARTQFRF
jgi:phosphate-selective porin OprO/OprP